MPERYGDAFQFVDFAGSSSGNLTGLNRAIANLNQSSPERIAICIQGTAGARPQARTRNQLSALILSADD